MNKPRYIRADEISTELNISIASAYRLIKTLKNELSEMDIITFAGRLDRPYYDKRIQVFSS